MCSIPDLFALSVILCFMNEVNTYSNGNIPLSVCSSMTPGHSTQAQTTASPYGIFLESSLFMPDQPLRVTLSVKTDSDMPFKGFYCQARKDSDNNFIAGHFIDVDFLDNVRGHDCFNTSLLRSTGSYTTVSHNSGWSSNPRNSITFEWMTTDEIMERFKFRCTFVLQRTMFWVGVESDFVTSLPKVSAEDCCEKDNIDENCEPLCRHASEFPEYFQEAKDILQRNNDTSCSYWDALRAVRCSYWSKYDEELEYNQDDLNECCFRNYVSFNCSYYCLSDVFARLEGDEQEFQYCVDEYPELVSCIIYPNFDLVNTTGDGHDTSSQTTTPLFSTMATNPRSSTTHPQTTNKPPFSTSQSTSSSTTSTTKPVTSPRSSTTHPQTTNSTPFSTSQSTTSSTTSTTKPVTSMRPTTTSSTTMEVTSTIPTTTELPTSTVSTSSDSPKTSVTPTAVITEEETTKPVTGIDVSTFTAIKWFSDTSKPVESTRSDIESTSVTSTFEDFKSSAGTESDSIFTTESTSSSSAQPPPPASSTVIFEITVTIDVTGAIDDIILRQNVLFALANDLLIPSLETLTGYEEVKVGIELYEGSLIVVSEGVFLQQDDGSIPLLSDVENPINKLLNENKNSIRRQNQIWSVITPIGVVRKVINGLCGADTCGSDQSCVEVGPDETVCVCVDQSSNEVKCVVGRSGLTSGAIAGIIVGFLMILLIVVVAILYICRNNIRSQKENSNSTNTTQRGRISSGMSNESYVEPDGENDEPLYMYISNEDAHPPPLPEDNRATLPSHSITYDVPNLEPTAPSTEIVELKENEDGYMEPVSSEKENDMSEANLKQPHAENRKDNEYAEPYAMYSNNKQENTEENVKKDIEKYNSEETVEEPDVMKSTRVTGNDYSEPYATYFNNENEKTKAKTNDEDTKTSISAEKSNSPENKNQEDHQYADYEPYVVYSKSTQDKTKEISEQQEDHEYLQLDDGNDITYL